MKYGRTRNYRSERRIELANNFDVFYRPSFSRIIDFQQKVLTLTNLDESQNIEKAAWGSVKFKPFNASKKIERKIRTFCFRKYFANGLELSKYSCVSRNSDSQLSAYSVSHKKKKGWYTTFFNILYSKRSSFVRKRKLDSNDQMCAF